MLLSRPLPSLGHPRYLADRSWAGSTGISPTGVAWRTPERGSGVGAGEIPALRNAPTARAVASQPAGLGDRLAPRESTPVVLLARSAARPGSPAGAGDGRRPNLAAVQGSYWVRAVNCLRTYRPRNVRKHGDHIPVTSCLHWRPDLYIASRDRHLTVPPWGRRSSTA